MKDDTISRQAAIEALLDKGQHSRRYKLGDIWELNFDEIREVIDALPAAEPKSYRMGYQAGMAAAQRWIPFAEHRPWEGQQILVCSEDGVMWITVFRSLIGFSGAWLPLPEPYKGES